MSELISIIMPFRNAEQYISQTIHSILDQTYTHWELIAVNDHSTDRSRELFVELASQDSRIRVFDNLEAGIIPALQKALQKTNGEFLTRMDADDLMPPNKLDLMRSALRDSPSKTIVTGMVKYFSDQPVSEGYLKYRNWINEINRCGKQWQNIYRECVIASPNWMMRRSELEDLGGFDQLSYPEDYHLCFKWYQNQFHVKPLSEITLLWREHPERTSRNSEHYDQEHFFRLKIAEFVKYEWNDEPIIIWGNNIKSRLARRLLKELHVTSIQMDLNNFEKIADYPKSQLLVAVYPPINERDKLTKYLEDSGRSEGENWWYL